MRVLSLDGSWKLSGAELDAPIKATVPGCVHTDLLAVGLIEDPYYRDNENAVQWIGEESWSFARDFDVREDLLSEEHVVLECEGLDTLARVLINGRVLASTENMFRRHELDARKLLRSGRNRIEVRFESPLPLIRKREKERHLPTWWFPGGGWVRKEYCNFGWDWGPTLVTCGIWKPIRIRAWTSARLADVRVRQRHDKRGTVHVDVETHTLGNTTRGATIEVTISHRDRPPLTVAGGLRKGRAVLRATVRKALLWWPKGMGEQPLYDVCVRLLTKDGEELHRRELRLGLRTLELRRENDQWGQSFEFVCNGVPFFTKGANWIPAETFATRVSRDDYARLVNDAVAANMNMLRVWGGGIYEHDTFYDLCDEAGICVWQDFMFACSTYPTFDTEWMANFEAEARDAVRRLRHHACLALWCGNNELEQGLVAKEWTESTMSWKDYGKLFDTLLPSVVKELDGDRPYWPCSPHTPRGSREDFNNPDAGDAHLWDVWHGRKPFEWYYTCRHRFVSEYGFQSFPHPRTVESFTLPEDRNVTSRIMEHHQRSGVGNALIMHYMLEWFRLPKDFESTVWLSQILQGIAIRILVEQLRRNMPRSMGSMYWQLNDCWPVASWSSIDSAGRWKALHYNARRFYAPHLISGVEDRDKGTVEIHVSCDAGVRGAATARWHVTNLEGRTLECGDKAVRLSAGKGRCVKRLDLSGVLENHAAHDVCVFLELAEGRRVLSSNLVLFARPKHMDVPATSAVDVKATARRDGSYTVVLKSRKPVLWLWLAHDQTDIACSDNFVHLEPGRTTRVVVTPAKSLGARAFAKGLRVRSLRDTYV